MARYIDTNYLFKCQTCRHFDGDECDTFCDSYECYSPDMSKIPTADVVEVVRCKDCKYSSKEKRYDTDEEYLACGEWCYYDSVETEPDGFCSYGERKEGDTR